MFSYLKRVSNISFQSFLFFSENDSKEFNYAKWALKKTQVNKLLNIETFKFASELKKRYADKEVFVDIYIGLKIFEHYKSRFCLIQRAPKSLKSKYLIYIASWSAYLAGNLIALLRIIKQLGYRLSLTNHAPNSKVIITKNFPSHSFSFSKKQDKFHSSFAEFIKNSQSEDVNIINIDEYRRKSKLLESDSSQIVDNNIEDIDRLHSYSIWKFSHLLKNLINQDFLNGLLNIKLIIIFGFNFYLNNILYKSINIRYEEFIDNLRLRNNNVINIYVLPFDLQLSMMNNENYRNLVVTYNYSENIVVPPSLIMSNNFININKVDLIGEYQYTALNLFKNQIVGFTRIPNLLNRLLKTYNNDGPAFTSDLAAEHLPDAPMALGYEVTEFVNPFHNGTFTIAIFDNPPETIKKQLERTLFGELTANFEVVSDFMWEISNLAIKNNFNIIIKPKYSLENYQNEYKNLLLSIKKRMGDNCLIISPYLRMGELVGHCDSTLSLPYTSTKNIFIKAGIPSFNYVPDKMIQAFSFEGYKSDDLIMGKNDLNSKLLKLKEMLGAK